MRRLLPCVSAVLLLVLSACGSPPPAVRPTSSPATITLTVSAEEPVEPGKVAWAWLPEETLAALDAGEPTDAMIVGILRALQVSDTVTLAARATDIGTVNAEGAGGFLVVLQRPGGNFLGTAFGRPSEGNRVALSELIRPASPDPMAVTVRLRPATVHTPREACVGARRELVRLEVPELEGEVGNDVERRLCVVLPVDYAASSVRRYPVVYLLHGFGGDHTTYLHLADEAPEAILVGIDSTAAFGASYFHDTAYAGAWEQLIEQAVAEVDRRYRTVADPSHRGLLGHSTGGYNAISLALRRTDLFMAAAASSPDGLDFDAWLFDGETARPLWLAWTRAEEALGGPGQMHSYAAQLDDASHPGALVWPFDLETGARDPEVWARWDLAHPMGLLRDPAVVHRIRAHLAGRLFISVGRNDAFGLYAPAESFHRRLAELEIEHTWVPTDETHFEGSARRREEGLAFLMRQF